MEPTIADPDLTVYQGHVLDVLRALPEKSVQCVVTSPPYYGLRAYGTEPQVWGGDAACGHEWGNETAAARSTAPHNGLTANADITAPRKNPRNPSSRERGDTAFVASAGAFCRRCRAWRGELGQEPTLDCLGWATGDPCGACYLCHIVAVFREVRRVLRDDGCLFLNMGDGFAGSWGNQGRKASRGTQRPINGPMLQPLDGRYPDKGSNTGKITTPGLKPKDLMGVPWRVAFALQADGYWLRNDLVWAKTACMPESVTDRATRSHEYIFHFSKKATYFYDAEAVEEVGSESPGAKWWRDNWDYAKQGKAHVLRETGQAGGNNGDRRGTTGRNQRTVWTIGPSPFPDAHFATFPPEIPRRCVLAGTSEKGCCAACGAPYVRCKEPTPEYRELLARANDRGDWYPRNDTVALRPDGTKHGKQEGGIRPDYVTTGWAPSCDCDAGPPVPQTVLDPFLGSGTTALVARQLGRRCVGIELQGEYLKMIRKRLAQQSLMLV